MGYPIKQPSCLQRNSDLGTVLGSRLRPVTKVEHQNTPDQQQASFGVSNMALTRRTPLKAKKAFKKPCPTVEGLMKSGLVSKGSSFKAKKKPMKKKGQDPWSKALDAACTAFSRSVRVRTAAEYDDNGIFPCFLCERPVHWKQAELMHVFTRAKLSVHFHDFNKPGCHECNAKPLGDRANYLAKLEEVYGVEEMRDFLAMSQITVHYSKEELQNMARGLKAHATEVEKTL